MGAFGPVRVPVGAPGNRASAPYRLIDNDACLLESTDLVFLDAIGTGYSRPRDPSKEGEYFGIDEDAAAFEQAIIWYLSSHGRFNDAKFVLGESFGAMRAVILANRLRAEGIDFSGLIFISGILSFAHFAPHLDQHSIDLLPSYAATAWYHERISRAGTSLEALLQEARTFARGPYSQALAQGHYIAQAECEYIAGHLEALTGIDCEWWIRGHLRAGIDAFRRELLRDKACSLGASDTRFTAEEPDGIGERPTLDAAHEAVAGAYQAAFEEYAARRLEYSTGLRYIAADNLRVMSAWNWAHQPPDGPKQNALASVVPDLAQALRANPKLELMVLCGYFDLMTPFFGMEYDLGKLYLSARSRGRLQLRHYPGGHMLYVAEDVREALTRDVRNFYGRVLAKQSDAG
jgi:carboxypeptidase C (cathepsin A)